MKKESLSQKRTKESVVETNYYYNVVKLIPLKIIVYKKKHFTTAY